MKSFTHKIVLLFISTVAFATLSGCTTAPLPSSYMSETSYDTSSLQLLEVYKNLEFRAANNNKFLYFQVIITADSTNRKYAQSILNLWLNSDGSHSKKTGFQFPVRKITHPFLKSQFSSITGWGGFKSILSDTQKVRVSNYLKTSESKILYFNPDSGSIDLIEPDGTRGFSISRKLTDKQIILDFIIPLNANGKEILGAPDGPGAELIVGFEILPGSNIFRSRPQTPQSLVSPGIGRPLQTTGRSNIGRAQIKKSSEIHWLNITLATSDKTP